MHAVSKGCQVSHLTPNAECHRKIDPCHALAQGMGGGRGDWVRDPLTDELVGNVFGGCRTCHEYVDGHKKECLEEMVRIARENGLEAIELGIKPILRGGGE